MIEKICNEMGIDIKDIRIVNLENEIKKLKQENQQLKKELDILFIQHINYIDKQDFAKICHISRPYLDKLLKNDMTRTEIYEFCLTRNKILKGVKDE